MAAARELHVHHANSPGQLGRLSSILGDVGINIDYAYTLTSRLPGEAAFVLAVIDPGAAEDLLE